jgi:hypothetical protein
MPVTPVHRPANVLVGVHEQIDLLHGGATPVIVDDPLDAIAIDAVSRASSKQYAGIPLCGAPLSMAQASMLARYCETDRLVVAVPAEPVGRRRAVRAALELATYFNGIKAIPFPPGLAISNHAQSSDGRQELLIYLSMAQPLIGGRLPGAVGNHHTALPIDDPGPEL